MYVFSSDMTSRPYEDNFQLGSVAKYKNLGGKNDAGKFDVFWKIHFYAWKLV